MSLPKCPSHCLAECNAILHKLPGNHNDIFRLSMIDNAGHCFYCQPVQTIVLVGVAEVSHVSNVDGVYKAVFYLFFSFLSH